MSISVRELQEWLETLSDDTYVGIDETDLCLRVVGDEGNYFEIGGMPDDFYDSPTDPGQGRR